jgi:DNA-binding MarR family transcriptional regulator
MTCEGIKWTQSRMLRALLRQNRWMKEGELAGYIRVKLADPVFEQDLRQLADLGLVAISPLGHGRSRKVELTVEGFNEAKRLKAEKNRQTAAEILSAEGGVR